MYTIYTSEKYLQVFFNLIFNLQIDIGIYIHYFLIYTLISYIFILTLHVEINGYPEV